jgi:hypothetical protein
VTLLKNSIHVAAAPDEVWAVLARLDALHEFDPGIERFFSGLKRYVERSPPA